MRKPVRVLYVLCKGRSGSTLTGLLLGAHPSIAPIGEIDSLRKWVRRVGTDHPPRVRVWSPFRSVRSGKG